MTRTARQQQDALRNGSLTAADLMAETYDRIEAINPSVNAIVSLLDRTEALDLARAADMSDSLGPLHGIPIAIKDLANAKGFPTTMGSPLFVGGKPAATDDIMVARLRAAGAIVIGKTNTPEFGLGSHTVNPVHGATLNPWNLNVTAGGSSGGAAVALATGMLSLADGSDMMGSLRNPAGWTSTYGLRPTWGAVPSEPVSDSFLHQLSTNGPMARTPADLALLLSIQSGPDPRQPHGIDLPNATAPNPKRIGWLKDWNGVFPMEEGILDTCQSSLAVLESLGHEIVEIDPGFAFVAMWESWTTLRSWQVAASLVPIEAMPNGRARLNHNALWELERGKALSALEVHRASVIRSQWFARATALFAEVDVLALPTAQCWPFPIEYAWPKEIAGVPMDTYHRWMQVVVPASLIGLPALAIPAGIGAAGLPMGLQLIGPRGADYDLIEIATPYHEAAEWAGKTPKL